MAGEMKHYKVNVGGHEAVVQYSDAEAKRRGLTPLDAPAAKAAKAPANKAAKAPANKAVPVPEEADK